MSNEKRLLGTELASTCNKTLPNIVSINSFVYIYMWPDHATILSWWWVLTIFILDLVQELAFAIITQNILEVPVFRKEIAHTAFCQLFQDSSLLLEPSFHSLGTPCYAHYQTFLYNWEILPVAGCCFCAFPQGELPGWFCQIEFWLFSIPGSCKVMDSEKPGPEVITF